MPSGKRWQILIVEDNRADIFLIREAIENAAVPADVHVVHDGQEANDFLDQTRSDTATCPDLILLDLNLPKESGEDVLRHMRTSESCKRTCVLIVSSSDLAADRDTATALGASGYFRKPSEYEAYLKLGRVVRSLLAGGQTEKSS